MNQGRRPGPFDVVLSLGSNMGDPVAHLREAIRELQESDVQVVAASTVHRTAPVGHADQADFSNVTLLARTLLAPADLLALAHRVEAAHDRRRVLRNGPRTLDIDIIAMTDAHGQPVVQADADHPPVLPHPRAHERGFVLVPWLGVDADALLPGHGRVDELVRALPREGGHVAGVLDTGEVVHTGGGAVNTWRAPLDAEEAQ